MRPIYAAQIKAGRGICGRCGRQVIPGQKFDVGHIVPDGRVSRQNVRLEHEKCNRSAGGKAGRALQQSKKKKDTGMFEW
jgi:hypothetical protein